MRVNIQENIMLSVPGIICMVWLLLALIKKPEFPDRLNIAAMIIHFIGCIMWFMITAVVWLFPGGHPPAAGLAALLGVFISLPLFAIGFIVALISCFKTEKVTFSHFYPMILSLVMLSISIYAALFIR